MILRQTKNRQIVGSLMVELEGLKPSTSSMPWKHSNQLSYSPIPMAIVNESYDQFNDGVREVTRDLYRAQSSSDSLAQSRQMQLLMKGLDFPKTILILSLPPLRLE